MNNQELNFLSKAINNENNENITEINKEYIIAEKDDVINKLNLSIQKKNKLIKCLKGYRYVEDLQEIIEGRFLRWLITKDNEITLSNGGILVEIKIEDSINLVLKNNRNNFFQINLDNNIIFQKLTEQEKIIILAITLL